MKFSIPNPTAETETFGEIIEENTEIESELKLK
jgi:hypothetical protein